MQEEEQQVKSIDDSSNVSQPSVKQDTQTTVLDNSESSSSSLKVKTESDLDTELSNSPKKQKKSEEITSTSSVPNNIDHQDISFNEKNVGYCSFSTTDKKPSVSKTKKPESEQSNLIKQILNQAAVSTSDLDCEENDEKKKIAAAKKLLFPTALATSFSEVSDSLRNERRQEFCPIYKDETPEEIVLRQAKQKPVGSLLAKRIHWDDLKRKREEEQRQAPIPMRYGPYGPIYANQQQSSANSYGQYNRTMQNQPQQSFANPYEQYYAAMQNQYEQMAQMARAQQEYNGFWPGYYQQSSLQNINQTLQNSIQQQNQPYTYPYPAMYYNNMAGMNTNIPSSDYNLYLNSLRQQQQQQQPPPPPPDEPYPY